VFLRVGARGFALNFTHPINQKGERGGKERKESNNRTLFIFYCHARQSTQIQIQMQTRASLFKNNAYEAEPTRF